MDSVAILATKERAALFEQTAAQMAVSSAIVEKDFWVCWALSKIATLPDNHPKIVFKGGTSLSKVFKVIRRFSEDIDLTIERSDLGFDEESDPLSAKGNERNRRLVGLRNACDVYVSDKLYGELARQLEKTLGPPESGWRLTPSADDRSCLLFSYPQVSDPTSAIGYLLPEVRLEVGARGGSNPSHVREVMPYAAEYYGAYFTEPTCRVLVLDAERTFWEKATILHQYAHGGIARARGRLARHYYDLALMAESELRQEALNKLELLAQVAKHKSIFFKSKWASYDEARPGSLRLVPDDDLRAYLAKDYLSMNEMFFEDPPSFDQVVAVLRELEDEINAAIA